jgi:peptidyl-prolyl cis-trans isomerase SurA
MLALVPGERKLVDRIVAVVNDEIITLSELEAFAKDALEEPGGDEKRKATLHAALDQLISDRLLQQQVTLSKIDVGEEEVDRAIKDILRQNNITDAELRQAVEARRMSMGQYREDLKTQLTRIKLIDLKVRSRVQVSDIEVKGEYDKLTATEEKDEMVSIRHIFFRWGDGKDAAERARVLKQATDARQRVLKGEDFGEVAKQLSQGPTATNGGDLGEVARKGLLPELAKAIEGIAVGEVTPPIETKSGVHIVRLDSRRAKEATPYAQMRNEIYQRLYTQEVDKQMKIWLEEVKASSAIDVRL